MGEGEDESGWACGKAHQGKGEILGSHSRAVFPKLTPRLLGDSVHYPDGAYPLG